MIINSGLYTANYNTNISPNPSSYMLVSGIQNHPLEVTVVGCNKLKDTEWISRQDPYVCLEYGSTKFRTRTCTDGGKNPTFQEKFVFSLIEGLREINIVVWNSNTLTHDDFIGNGKVQLQKVLSQGYDDSAWSLQTKTGRYAGEVRLILHHANAIHAAKASAPLAPPYIAPQVPLYSAPPPTSAASYPPPASAAYPPTVTAYHSSQPSPYPPQPVAYSPPPSAYPPHPPPSTYPPLPLPSAYAPPSYPPSSPYHPPGHFYRGPYPPPSYNG